MDYAEYVRSTSKNNNKTPQSEPVAGKNQKKNAAGGYVFEIDKWQKLDRFLVLGTEGGTYYVSEKQATLENFDALEQCMQEDCIRVIDRVVELSESGRISKNDPALFVLAKASADQKYQTNRRYALNKLPRVARTGTHLFHFVKYAQVFRGWGRAFKRGVADWYNEKSIKNLSYQLAKYKQRDGWSHRDILRLAHPKANDDERNLLFQKVTHPEIALPKTSNEGLEFYRIADQLSIETKPDVAAKLIKKYNIPRECINTQLLNDQQIWDALLENMPMTALVRNLGKISSLGMTDRYSDHAKRIVQQLTNAEKLKAARVHPIAILTALSIYKTGAGMRGSLSWNPNREIVEALNDAFYLAFDNVTPTNKRYMLGLDISGSMSWSNNGVLEARTIAAAMAMVTLRTEPTCYIKGFSNTFMDLNISKRMLLDEVIRNISGLPFGSTDCALPMQFALQNKLPVDAFIVYTDNDTWCGGQHPYQAIKQYRQEMDIPAKLVVVATQSSPFSIADPKDAGMLDVAGFDTSVPQIISDFINEKVATTN